MNESQSKERAGVSIVALMAALLVAIFAFQLNASMLSPALATMQRELATTPERIALSQTTFFTVAALFSLFLPRLADLVGRKKVLTGMLLATAVGCVLSAMAPNLGVLMVGRVFQGASGPVVPLCLIMLKERVPNKNEYVRLMAILTSVNGGIGGVDALLGGWLASTGGFRAVFGVMALVCVIAVVMVAMFAEESRSSKTQKMDWVGVVFLVIAVGSALLGFDEAGKLTAANWILVAAYVVIATISFMVFWRTEKRVAHPMVSTTYLKQRRTWALLATTTLTMTGVFAIMNGIVPALAQDGVNGAGLGAEVVSFSTLTPYALAGLVFGPIAGVLASRFGCRAVLRVGLVLTIVGLLFGMYVAGAPSIGALLVMSIAVGITYAGTVNIMLNGLGIMLSPKDNAGYLPGLNAGAFNLGAGISFVVLYAAMNAFAQSGGAVAGYRGSFTVGVILLVLAFLVSLLIPNPDKLID
ncbi:MAG: MFS transporter [Gordonibacter sp.]|nr:MFS transporter [Gordonibacter sp.]